MGEVILVAKIADLRNSYDLDRVWNIYHNLSLHQKLGIMGIFGLVALPVVITPLQLVPTIVILYTMAFAMSWDLVSGYTGQLSFGHAFFFAIGGYSSAILNVQHGITPIFSIPLAGVIAGFGGLILGIPTLRLRGMYLALVTLVAPIILERLFRFWASEFIIIAGPIVIPIAPEGFGGVGGLASPQALVSISSKSVVTVSNFSLGALANYYLSLGIILILLLIMMTVTRSPVGEIFTAIRENEEVAAASGINTKKFKIYSFVLSGVIAGIASATFVHTIAAAPQPDQLLNFELSIMVIIYSVIGGMSTIIGPALGVIFIEGLHTIFGQFDISVYGYTIEQISSFVIFALAVGMIIKRPGGLLPMLIRFINRRSSR